MNVVTCNISKLFAVDCGQSIYRWHPTQTSQFSNMIFITPVSSCSFTVHVSDCRCVLKYLGKTNRNNNNRFLNRIREVCKTDMYNWKIYRCEKHDGNSGPSSLSSTVCLTNVSLCFYLTTAWHPSVTTHIDVCSSQTGKCNLCNWSHASTSRYLNTVISRNVAGCNFNLLLCIPKLISQQRNNSNLASFYIWHNTVDHQRVDIFQHRITIFSKFSWRD